MGRRLETWERGQGQIADCLAPLKSLESVWKHRGPGGRTRHPVHPPPHPRPLPCDLQPLSLAQSAPLHPSWSFASRTRAEVTSRGLQVFAQAVTWPEELRGHKETRQQNLPAVEPSSGVPHPFSPPLLPRVLPKSGAVYLSSSAKQNTTGLNNQHPFLTVWRRKTKIKVPAHLV